MKPALAILALACVASPALADMPGSVTFQGGCYDPLTVGKPGVTLSLHELSPGGGSCYARQGAVVLLRDPAQDAQDPANWTDVAIFFEPGAPWHGGYATDVGIVSEENPAGGIGGIQDADVSFSGATIADILYLNTIYLPKDPSSITPYDAVTPTWTQHYFLRSDPNGPVPTFSRTLGRLKAIYR